MLRHVCQRIVQSIYCNISGNLENSIKKTKKRTNAPPPFEHPVNPQIINTPNSSAVVFPAKLPAHFYHPKPKESKLSCSRFFQGSPHRGVIMSSNKKQDTTEETGVVLRLWGPQEDPLPVLLQGEVVLWSRDHPDRETPSTRIIVVTNHNE